jgi:hypothetical protein
MFESSRISYLRDACTYFITALLITKSETLTCQTNMYRETSSPLLGTTGTGTLQPDRTDPIQPNDQVSKEHASPSTNHNMTRNIKSNSHATMNQSHFAIHRKDFASIDRGRQTGSRQRPPRDEKGMADT